MIYFRETSIVTLGNGPGTDFQTSPRHHRPALAADADEINYKSLTTKTRDFLIESKTGFKILLRSEYHTSGSICQKAIISTFLIIHRLFYFWSWILKQEGVMVDSIDL